MKLTTATRSTLASQIIAAMAAGTTASPVIEIYTGAIPASLGGAITDTLLATLTLTNAVATQSNGVITFQTITDDSSADATGTAGWARILDRDGAEAMYLTVGASGSGKDIELSAVAITAGDAVSIASGSITVGGA